MVVSIPQAVWIACNEFYIKEVSVPTKVSIPQAVWIACNSGYRFSHALRGAVSIPQAVWIACNFVLCKCFRPDSYSFNTASGMDCMQFSYMFSSLESCETFQYRKRYGLHAIPSLTALGTAEPRSGFSKRIALLDRSPQPRGIFLSPKSAENVRKPYNIKETFVHGKNLKLMAFSPKSLPSL